MAKKQKKIDRINAVIYWYNKQVLNLTNLNHGYITKGGYQKMVQTRGCGVKEE